MYAEEGSKASIRFLSMSFAMHCNLDMGSLKNQNFQSTLGCGVTKKKALCTLFL